MIATQLCNPRLEMPQLLEPRDTTGWFEPLEEPLWTIGTFFNYRIFLSSTNEVWGKFVNSGEPDVGLSTQSGMDCLGRFKSADFPANSAWLHNKSCPIWMNREPWLIWWILGFDQNNETSWNASPCRGRAIPSRWFQEHALGVSYSAHLKQSQTATPNHELLLSTQPTNAWHIWEHTTHQASVVWQSPQWKSLKFQYEMYRNPFGKHFGCGAAAFLSPWNSPLLCISETMIAMGKKCRHEVLLNCLMHPDIIFCSN